MVNRFTKGVLFGSLVGGVSGLFFAPRKGKETQEKLKQTFTESLDDIKTVQQDFQTVQEQLLQAQAVTNELVPTFQKDLKKEIQDFKFQANPRLARIREQLEILKKHVNESPFKEKQK